MVILNHSMSKKPKSAFINQQNALLNIQTKISIIEEWIKNGIPQEIDSFGKPIQMSDGRKKLDFYPATLRQFNFWEYSKHCPGVMATLPPIWRNANDTLRRYPSLRDQVVSLLKELVKIGERESKAGNSTLAALRRKLAVTEARKSVVEAQFSGQRRQICDLQQAVKNLEAQMTASLDEAARINARLEAEVASLRSEKAELTQALMKIKPFKAVT